VSVLSCIYIVSESEGGGGLRRDPAL
jgi:hypothetical protein